MVFHRRFLIAAAVFATCSLVIRLFRPDWASIWLEHSYVGINLPYMLFAAAFTLVIPGLVLLLLEMGFKRQPPPKLTRISFLFHLCGLLILVCAVPTMIYADRISSLANALILSGLIITVISMSLLPAILLIALHRGKS